MSTESMIFLTKMKNYRNVSELFDCSVLRDVLVKISSDGMVSFKRMFRLHAAFDPEIYNYPYDTQMTLLKISSGDYTLKDVQVSFLLQNKLSSHLR